MTIEQLKADVETAKAALAQAEKALAEFETDPEQNVFASLEDAEHVLMVRMHEWAHDDCEGSHNCGSDKYEQEFIVDGVHYLATLECEYNRHDKTYYYLEEATFSYKEIDATPAN